MRGSIDILALDLRRPVRGDKSGQRKKSVVRQLDFNQEILGIVETGG